MKLALVNLEMRGGVPPLGLAYIASYIRKYGSFNNTIIIDKEDPIKRIKKEKPDVVGISSLTHEYNKVINLAEKIREQFDISIILGGSHISVAPETFNDVFDIAVIGEGEQTVLELAEADFIPSEKIKGLLFKKDGKMIFTGHRELIEPLDRIPFPARDLLKMREAYLIPRMVPIVHKTIGRGTHIITSRGCPYNCVFCANNKFWGRKVRFHSPEYIIEEIKFLIKEYKIENLTIYDDIFIMLKERLEKFSQLMVESGLVGKIKIGCQGRANLMTPEICELLKKAGIGSLTFGFESNSRKVLTYLKKNVTPEDNENAVRLCREYGLTVGGFFILGSPMETMEDVEETLKFIKTPLDFAAMVMLSPLPGTEVYEYAKSKGLLPKLEESERYAFGTPENSIILSECLSKEELSELMKEIEKITLKINYGDTKIDLRSMMSVAFVKKLLRSRKSVFSYLKGNLYKIKNNPKKEKEVVK